MPAMAAKWKDEFPDIDRDQLSLLTKVDENGGSVGNKTLRTALGWDEETYYSKRQPLLNAGLLETGRGKGGSVKLTAKAIDTSSEGLAGDQGGANRPAAPADPYQNGNLLYDPMLKTLERVWIGEQRFTFHEIVKTAEGGRRADGKWSRPDITVVAETHFRHLPGKILDVVTFEIKHHSGFDITSVYEALSHRKAATYAYVLAYIPTREREKFTNNILEVAHEATRHGIGLIVAENPEDWETWEIIAESIREEPDHRRLNEFIENQLGKDIHDKLVLWFK